LIAERDAFGPSLKSERDRRGITLQAIADSTKISLSLLAALERNDMSRWPKGIFRRAFVREYVAALGLPPEPIVAEFVRLFPDGPRPEVADVGAFRLTFEREPSATRRVIYARAFIAIIEVCGVLAVGSTAAWLLDTAVWPLCGAAALVYYPLASVFLERAATPRLLFQPAVPARWLRSASTPLKRLRPLWKRPALSIRSPETEGTDSAATAPEWRTAPN